jgi:sulfite reductase (ferredoxin)
VTENAGAPDQRKVRSEGQWAAGDRQPLNDNERIKQEDDGLNVRRRIEEVYSRTGIAGVDLTDRRSRFRWWGMYTQRRAGIPGSTIGSLAPEEIEDDCFMMRVRIDGGALTTAQLRVLGEVAREFARDTADLTDRQNVQLHWVYVEDVPQIWQRIEAVGLTTVESAGDTPRVVLGSPLAGITEDEVLDITPGIADITGRLLNNPEYSNLPRKFKTAISGLQDVAHEINDVAFVGVHHPEHGPGLDVWVGGGLSTNPKIAQRLGAWVSLAEVGEVWEAIVALFRDHGYRRLRNKARLKFLVADWGAERFRAVLEEDYLHRKLIDGPPPPQLQRPRDHVGVQRQKNGHNAVGVSPVAGRVGGTRLVAAAAAAERAGSRRVRITPMQKLVVLDVPDDRVEELIAELDAIGLPARPSPWRRATMACTGDEFCKYGIVETKDRAARLIDELEERLADVQDTLESPISIHLNGCPNSCARIQVADIGLKGMALSTPDGGYEDGFQLHLGGALGFDTTFGRKIRGNKVRSADVADYIERIVRRYADQRSPGERFAQWVARASDTDLAV